VTVMTTSFDEALRFVLRWEGGLSDDPHDHGGRTMKGVTQRVYDAWRKGQGLGTQDVALIADDELSTIYRDNYWIKAKCSQLQAKLDLVQFDTGVNMGPNRAIKILQNAVGTTADGVFGPATLAACQACTPADTVARYCQIREDLYNTFAQRQGQSKFLRGWMNRLNDLRAEAGVASFKRTRSRVDFGDTGSIAHIPDIAPGQPLDAW
jgi:lysozyme family protein